MIVCGAASGIADALRIALRTKLLDLMGVEDPALPPDAPRDGRGVVTRSRRVLLVY
jgi:hypothetical protein